MAVNQTSDGSTGSRPRQAEVDAGEVPGVTGVPARDIRELRRNNNEFGQTIEMLKAATTLSRGSVVGGTSKPAEWNGKAPNCSLRR